MFDHIPEKLLGTYSLHMMREGEAPGVVDLYRHTYGDLYPIKEMYDADYILDQQRQGFAYRVVVTDAAGQVVAHQGIFRLPEVYKGLYENGHGMVHTECRNQGLSSATFNYISEVMAPGLEIEEQWGEAVCNHLMSQKGALDSGFKETGLELDLMPAATYDTEKGRPGRVGVLVASNAYIEKAQEVFLPFQYKEILRRIYSNAGRERSLKTGGASLPEDQKTATRMTFFKGPGVLRVSVMTVGNDLDEHLHKIWDEYAGRDAYVLQAVISLQHPWSGAAVEVLNRQGFFFGALVPRWFDSDGLMLQRTLHEPDYEGLHLYSDFAHELLEYIRQDRCRVMIGQA